MTRDCQNKINVIAKIDVEVFIFAIPWLFQRYFLMKTINYSSGIIEPPAIDVNTKRKENCHNRNRIAQKNNNMNFEKLY